MGSVVRYRRVPSSMQPLSSQSAARGPTELVVTSYGAFEAPRGDTITEQLHRYGAHQRSDLAAALTLVRTGDVVVDVGGHIGTFAVPMARAAGRDGRVYAFEASPDNYALLRLNAERNVPGRIVAQQALVGRPQQRFRSVEVDGNTGMTWFEHASDGEGDGVPGLGLDEWLSEHEIGGVHFLKVDVEGMELEVLESAQRIVEAHKPVVMAELSGSQLARRGASPGQLARWLTARGYRLYVNVHDRNVPEDVFRPARIPHVAVLRLGGPRFGLRDVIAVHRDSDRHPAGASGRTGLTMLAARERLRMLVR